MERSSIALLLGDSAAALRTLGLGGGGRGAGANEEVLEFVRVRRRDTKSRAVLAPGSCQLAAGWGWLGLLPP